MSTPPHTYDPRDLPQEPGAPRPPEASWASDIGRIAAWTARCIAWFIYAVAIVTEVILLLGFVLKLFGANPSAGFVEWVYRSLDRAMAPFRGMFEPIDIGTAANDVPAVLDTSILFAMLTYAVILLAFRVLLDWLARQISRMDRPAPVEAPAQSTLYVQQTEVRVPAGRSSATGTAVRPWPAAGSDPEGRA
jgi:hypothetical protein